MERTSPVVRMTVLASLLAASLAGCVGGDEAVGGPLHPTAVDGADLQEEGFYAFDHRGGPLRIGLADGGNVALQLHGPDDRRLGRLELSPDTFGDDVLLEALDTGRYVVALFQLNGTLHVESAGRPVDTFYALGGHLERVILAEAPLQTDPITGIIGPLGPPFSGGETIDQQSEVVLERTPVMMRLLGAGQATSAAVSVRGPVGTAFAAEHANGYSTRFGYQSADLQSLGGEFQSQNAKGRTYTVGVQASDFQGVLILEAYSYSRHVPTNAAPAYASEAEDIAFTYGELPSRPVAFQVHDRATRLYAWTPHTGPGNGTAIECETDGQANATDCEEPAEEQAWLAIFDPADRLLGRYRIEAGTPIEIPIDEGGDYVAVQRGGIVYLGADRVPVDFEMHVLDVQETIAPEQRPGDVDDYEQETGNLSVPGVPYTLEIDTLDPDQGGGPSAVIGPLVLVEGCATPGTLRVLSGGETVAVWGDMVLADAQAPVHVFAPSGPLAYVQDGMGGNCGQTTATVMSYTR